MVFEKRIRASIDQLTNYIEFLSGFTQKSFLYLFYTH